jgi:MipA family protein
LNPKRPTTLGKRIAASAVLPFLCWHGAAYAQNDGPPEGQGGGDHISIGIGAAYMPAHHGSSKYRFQPLPAIDIQKGRYFVNFQDGIGANLIDTEYLTIGAGLTMADNYRAKDVPKGIGKLAFGVGARGFMKFRQGGFEATIGGTQIIAGSTGGFVADANLAYPIMLMPSIGTSWANRKHNDRYFGVTALQSTASGLRQFRAGSGLVDAKAELAAQFRLTERIGLGVSAGVTSLIGDVKNSPIVQKKTRPFGLMFISYTF